MRLLTLWLQMAVKWLHECCMGLVLGGRGKAGARNRVFFRVKWLRPAMKGTSCVRRVRLRSFQGRIGSSSVFCNEWLFMCAWFYAFVDSLVADRSVMAAWMLHGACVGVACFLRIALSALDKVVTVRKFRGRRGILWDVMKNDGSLHVDFEVGRHFTLYTSLHTLLSTLYTPRSTLYTLHSTLDTLDSTLDTPHSTLCTSHFTLHTWHSTLYIFHFPLRTLHFTLYTLHFTLYILHPTPYTFHFPLHTLHFTLSTLHFTLHTLHFTTPHFTLYTPHFALHTLHSILYT